MARKLGIVRSGHHLAFGVGHGWLKWTPFCLRNTIVRLGNKVLCRAFGHDDTEWHMSVAEARTEREAKLLKPFKDSPKCMDCGAPLTGCSGYGAGKRHKEES